MIHIPGNKYNFEIVCQNCGESYQFYIRALCKSTGRYSCINNLNTILSELEIDTDDSNFEDSTWIVDQDEAKYFTRVTEEIITDITYRDYLEHRLDEDRILGEWENRISL
ncbi:MAG: hypothetical protein HQ591_00985 [candidate division Zixibacteria bacterium]|nr:hypothetical protein [Candidatus Tariuqbacter arcticus]